MELGKPECSLGYKISLQACSVPIREGYDLMNPVGSISLHVSAASSRSGSARGVDAGNLRLESSRGRESLASGHGPFGALPFG